MDDGRDRDVIRGRARYVYLKDVRWYGVVRRIMLQ